MMSPALERSILMTGKRPAMNAPDSDKMYISGMLAYCKLNSRLRKGEISNSLNTRITPIPMISPTVTPMIAWIKDTMKMCALSVRSDHPSDFSIPISRNRYMRAVSCVFTEKITRKRNIMKVSPMEDLSMIDITLKAG